ncbi:MULTISPECIES: transporter substrate-binding domain-containing protein [Zoogloea]|jgi:polar amino acid transport system substrate-binding protein|nr:MULTISPECIES: transporter substrate-binding domain-containing protein [Zoogloea]MDD2670415.1 transporter substrate-binding domain-containing protein [Zoogloea sp.]MDY0036965.1 transporter substrate-binding domain-containing protein [Zoogloea oleivorans]
MTRLPQRRLIASALALLVSAAGHAGELPDCSRPLSLALHEHGLLYSRQSGEGIDRDIADELIRRSGCTINVTVLPRARIWQLIESGGLDFSLSGITSESRERFAAFAWYFSNKYYLLVRRDAGVQRVGDFTKNPDLRLGAIRSFRYSPTANRLVDSLDAEQRVSFASSLTPLYEILLANQVQGMIIEPFDYPALESSHIRTQTTILEFDDPPVPHGLIMSKRSLPPREQAKWRALVDDMRADGSIERIFEKYFKPELARAMTRF